MIILENVLNFIMVVEYTVWASKMFGNSWKHYELLYKDLDGI
jgi:hypothetical protein